jgi:7-cyano-7-deazaguanine synthase in queuosine biosynthesis
MDNSKKVLILFSGGADSTATAAYYLKNGYYVHLVTYDNGAERNLHCSEKKANIIISKFPGRVQWELLDSRDLFHRLAIKSLETDVKKYGNLVCCGCKVAMLAKAIVYCRQHSIKIIADGFEEGQIYYPEQTPEYIEVTAKLASKYGITYEHPLYKLSKDEIENLKLAAGIPPEPLQAACLFGENRLTSQFIRQYTTDKIPLAEEYIDECLNKKP